MKIASFFILLLFLIQIFLVAIVDELRILTLRHLFSLNFVCLCVFAHLNEFTMKLLNMKYFTIYKNNV